MQVPSEVIREEVLSASKENRPCRLTLKKEVERREKEKQEDRESEGEPESAREQSFV